MNTGTTTRAFAALNDAEERATLAEVEELGARHRAAAPPEAEDLDDLSGPAWEEVNALLSQRGVARLERHGPEARSVVSAYQRGFDGRRAQAQPSTRDAAPRVSINSGLSEVRVDDLDDATLARCWPELVAAMDPRLREAARAEGRDVPRDVLRAYAPKHLAHYGEPLTIG